MTSEGLGGMFEGDSADMCAGKFLLMSMGGPANRQLCADGERGPQLVWAEISLEDVDSEAADLEMQVLVAIVLSWLVSSRDYTLYSNFVAVLLWQECLNISTYTWRTFQR